MKQTTTSNRIRLFAALFVIGLVNAGPVSAQDAALPPAQELIDRHVKQVNAQQLVELGSLRTVSEFRMASMGMTGEIRVSGHAPNLMSMQMTLPGLGEISSGYNGEVAWSMNPMEGPRLMTGDELAQIRDEADFDANVRSDKLIDSMETVERTEMGGKACWKVKLTWKSGRETFDCYDVETGYLVGTLLTTQTAMGPVESVITFEDYTDFDGVMLPRVSTQQAFGQEMVVTLQSARFGDVDPAMFELPEAIKALVGK
jgi:hypothetical protein